MEKNRLKSRSTTQQRLPAYQETIRYAPGSTTVEYKIRITLVLTEPPFLKERRKFNKKLPMRWIMKGEEDDTPPEGTEGYKREKTRQSGWPW